MIECILNDHKIVLNSSCVPMSLFEGQYWIVEFNGSENITKSTLSLTSKLTILKCVSYVWERIRKDIR